MTAVTVKLCGIRTLEHARAAVEAGAEYLGFVLAPGYRRHVAPEVVREITSALGRGRARYVGVFVDPDPEEARRVALYAGLDLVQLSGQESPADVRAVGVEALKVVHVAAEGNVLPEVERYAEVARMVVLDAYKAGSAGGNGQAFEWSLAAEVTGRYPVMLAGGLTPETVAAAIAAVRPAGVDVSSGIETEGVKDPEKMRAFVEAVREAR